MALEDLVVAQEPGRVGPHERRQDARDGLAVVLCCDRLGDVMQEAHHHNLRGWAHRGAGKIYTVTEKPISDRT